MNWFDGTGYELGDIGLAMLITLSALLTYARIAFEMGSLKLRVPRSLIALGFTVLAIRFWWTILSGGDVTVAPISLVSMTLVTVGYCIVQIAGIRRSVALVRVPIFCFRDPEWPCQREDRVQEAILKEMRK